MKTSRDRVVNDSHYLTRAAEILEEEAELLRSSYALANGDWPTDDDAARAHGECAEWRAVAAHLRRMVLVAGRST